MNLKIEVIIEYIWNVMEDGEVVLRNEQRDLWAGYDNDVL